VKLLFDRNVSPSLCRALADLFPDAVHVREVGLREAGDAVIWEYASRHGFAIISKDADFRQRSFLEGHLPRIWLRLGNCSTKAIEAVLRNRAADLEEFLANETKSLLAVS